MNQMNFGQQPSGRSAGSSLLFPNLPSDNSSQQIGAPIAEQKQGGLSHEVEKILNKEYMKKFEKEANHKVLCQTVVQMPNGVDD